VTNFTATAGQTSFSVPSYTVGYIDVFRNGVRLVNAGSDFVATTGTTVVLNNACTVGDSVVTESFYVSSVLNAIPATAGAVNTTYITDAAVTQAKLAANVAGTGPAFSAYQSSSQTLTIATYTKLNFQTEEYDTNSNFDTTTSRFTPNVAGYYLFTGSFEITTTQATLLVLLYKNGSSAKLLQYTAGVGNTASGSATFYMNGSTDYVELYGYSSLGNAVNASSLSTYFQASLVRAA
jgi:hypothetical protein